MHHRRQPHTERGVDEFHLDYCFPGDEFGFKLTVLVGVERYTGMKLASVVPTKGATGMFAARRVVELMNECGNRDTHVIVRTDQEPAIKFLVADVLKLRTGAKTMVEEAPKKSSGSNSFVERAVQTCEGYIRSLKSQLDERYAVKIDIGHPIVTWLCEYATYLLNRFVVGRDGKTSYERMKGKRATVLGVEFGERIMLKEKPVGALRKMIPQWQLGVFLSLTDVKAKNNYYCYVLLLFF